jgi:hypothetical protein
MLYSMSPIHLSFLIFNNLPRGELRHDNFHDQTWNSIEIGVRPWEGGFRIRLWRHKVAKLGLQVYIWQQDGPIVVPAVLFRWGRCTSTCVGRRCGRYQ